VSDPAKPPPLPRRRTRYIVQRQFQAKYAGWLLVVCVLVAWLVGATVYMTAMQQLGAKIEQIYPQSRAVAIFQSTQLTLVRNLLWLIPVLLIVSVWMSHKIAGPLVRIKRMVDEIGYDDVPGPIKLRKYDELKDLAASLNAMSERLRSRTGGQQQTVEAMQSTVEELGRILSQPTVDPAQARRMLDALRKQAGALNGAASSAKPPSSSESSSS